MSVAEMRMLRWISGATREDRIRNEYMRGNIVVTSIMKQSRHVMRREDSRQVRTVMEMNVKERKGRSG